MNRFKTSYPYTIHEVITLVYTLTPQTLHTSQGRATMPITFNHNLREEIQSKKRRTIERNTTEKRRGRIWSHIPKTKATFPFCHFEACENT